MRFERVGLAIGLGTAVAFWVLIGRAQNLQQQLRTSQRSQPLVFVVNGLKIDLDAHLDRRIARDAGVTTYFVLISSDRCQFCHTQLPVWQTFLREMPFDARHKVIVVSHFGQAIPSSLTSTLTARSVNHEVRAVTSGMGFTQATGVSWTPAFLVLDADMRLRASTYSLSEPSMRALIEWLRSHADTSPIERGTNDES